MTKEELHNLKRIPKEDILWHVIKVYIKIIETKADSQTLKNFAKEGIRDIITIANRHYLETGQLK